MTTHDEAPIEFTIRFRLEPYEVEFQTTSLGKAADALEDEKTGNWTLAGRFPFAAFRDEVLATAQGGSEANTETASAETDKPKRGRRPRNSPDPATAVAPPPLAVPSAAPAPAAPVDTSIPPFLDRTGAATATIAPPPPVPAPAPAAPPPVGVLAGKVVAELKRRGEGAADNGKALVDWLASAGLVVPGATFQEACDCVSFLSDEKVGPVAQGLNVQ